jgi:hypothetical protein
MLLDNRHLWLRIITMARISLKVMFGIRGARRPGAVAASGYTAIKELGLPGG